MRISNWRIKRWIAGLCLATALGACGETSYNEIALMPPPTVYEGGTLDPFASATARRKAQQAKLFYATDRRVAGPEDASDFYANDRGLVLRTGTVDVAMTPPAGDWDTLRRISTGQDDTERSLSVVAVREFGPMPFSISDRTGAEIDQAQTDRAARDFAGAINRQLSLSGGRDVVIYVHGYNVDFEYPTLVARELQHYLGYRGAFVSYNWPATPSRFAYFRDLETASATRRNLRELIEFLSTRTQARRVHLIGYSAGSRLVFETAYQIALQGEGRAQLGQVVLIGSDLDRLYFVNALADGILDGMDQLSIYMSGSDAALGLSEFVFGQNRLGQIAGTEATPDWLQRKLLAENRLALINATDAPGADAGNGHWYFRSAPWASSDILLTLSRGASPAKRGLVRPQGNAIWQFPADYPERLRTLPLLN